MEIEQAVLDIIDLHLPDDCEADNVSVSFDPADISLGVRGQSNYS